MSALLPVAFWGLEVPPGDVIVPATPEYPATFRITMAAIDPSHAPSANTDVANGGPERATLKIIRSTHDPEDDSEGESDDGGYLQALLAGSDADDGSEDDDTDSDEEENGGPSDPERTKKARKQQALEDLKKMLALDEDEEMEDKPNGALDKGKGKATGDESESDEDNDDLEVETFVVCTLDPTKTYQQPLDITIGENEQVFFKVTGTHAVYLTGNYVIPADEHTHSNEYDSDEDSDEYDLSPDEEDLEYDSESDELDGLEDPRITEIETDEEEAPKLVQAKKGKAVKGKNKRAAEDSDDEPVNLDDIMAKSLKTGESKTNGEQPLSKKEQKKLKKLKNNAGEAVEKKADVKDDKNGASKVDKKVKFAKDLEQGPTKTTKIEGNSEVDQKEEKSKAGLGVKTVQGVKVDDKVLGKGSAAKKGSKVSMRYIGKLVDGKVFDANKKGPPFSFKLGSGEVIKGWDIGVAGIAAGGQRRLTIPANLAYGSKGAPGIPANSTLVFDIKCLEVK